MFGFLWVGICSLLDSVYYRLVCHGIMNNLIIDYVSRSVFKFFMGWDF
jgi:hypothetical protein